MANTHRAPKQWCLSTHETITSFESWRQNLQYTLSLDTHFAPLLIPGTIWEKRSTTRNNPFRGFQDDPEDVPDDRRLSAQQKVIKRTVIMSLR